MLIFIFAVLALVSGVSYGIPVDSQAASLDSRIHGGVDAPLGYSPHMVALLTGDRWIFLVCGGSIVSDRHVLTAAHCVTPFLNPNHQLAPTFHGRVGSNIWRSGGTLVQFQEHYIHPQWDPNTLKYDVAIISLTSCLTLHDKVAVIGLHFGAVEGGERGYVTGWGTTLPIIDDNMVQLAPTPDNLQLLYLSTLDHKECVKKILSVPHWNAIAPPIIDALEICTFYSVGKGMCHGDSGSALVLLESGKQCGVVSWGIPCAQGAPDVHPRLGAPEIKNFILDIISKKLSCREQPERDADQNLI